MRVKSDTIINGFDASYYLLTNPDVAAAGVDPLAHFLSVGWHEGRMPDGLFDVESYLASNPDVAAAGVNPLLHYLTRGAAEGRDPSPLFDTDAYLAANPDVAAAGVNPLQHYLQFGVFEGRLGGATAASPTAGNDFLVGTPGSDSVNAGAGNDFVIVSAGDDTADGGSGTDTVRFGHKFTDYHITVSGDTVTVDGPDGHDVYSNFERFAFTDGTIERNDSNALIDDLYYYANNPDVWAAGIDAAQHFAQFGWNEGRNPNQYFDVTYYLTQYPDVAAAGVNPLQHYLTAGWHEGRNPSASFNTNAYLAANPDVAAAGVNPLQHFLDAGKNEGRSPLGIPPNSAPSIDALAATLTFTEGQAAQAIDTAITIADADNANLVGATISISHNFAAGQDILGFTDQHGITGSYDAATGVLALSGAATVADYQTALRSVTYSNASQNPSAITREVTFKVDDGEAGHQSSAGSTATIAVIPVNDAPAGTDKTVTITEDGSYTFSAGDFGFADPVDGAHSLLAVTITAVPAAGQGTLTLTLADSSSVPVTNGQVINAADIPGLVFTPAHDANGTNYASFAFKVQDNGGTTNGGIDLDPTANTITINVTAVDDAPSNIKFTQSAALLEGSVAANVPGVVGQVTATDVESNPFTFSLRHDDGTLATDSPFQIDANTGQVKLSANATPLSLDYEVEGHAFDLIVRATETGNPAVYRDQVIHVALSDVANESTASGVEGYIKNATVYIDENNNGQLDATDYSVTTDAFGNFAIIGTHTGNMYLSGGIDIATGLAFTGILRAPSGSTVLTPLTTLVAVLTDGGTPAATASQQVAAALGLTTTNLTSYDPIAASINGVTQADKDAGAAAFAAGVQVYNTIVQASSLLSGAGATGSTDAVVSVIANQLQAAATAPTPTTVDLSQSATLVSVINDAATIAPTATPVSTQTISDAADVISGSNGVIQTAVTNSASNADFLVTVAAAANVAQGDAAAALSTAGQNDNASSAKTAYTGTNLDAAVTTASASVDANAVAGANGSGTLVGTAGSDLLDGQGGDDFIYAGGGKDILIGGTGNDFLDGDTLDGNQANRFFGFDRADYSGATEAINVNMGAGTVIGGASVGTDTLRGIEGIIGTNFADTYDGSTYSATSVNNGGIGHQFTTGLSAVGNVNQFEGRGGNDDITAGGITRISYESADAGVTIDLINGTAHGTAGGDLAHVGTDTLHGFFSMVRGSNFNDTIIGTNNAAGTTEQFQGLGGDDFINGNNGFDRVRYDFATPGALGIKVNLGAGTVDARDLSDSGAVAVVGHDTLRGIEAIRGSQAADIYDASTFTGPGPSASVNNGGDQGNFNEFEGLGGDDTITGNNNTRIAYYSATSGVTVVETGFNTGTVTGDASVGLDTYTAVNFVVGSTFNDTFTGYNNGSGSVEQFAGYSGDDVIDGGLGFDRARYDSNNGDSEGVPMGTLGLRFNLAAGTETALDAAGLYNYGNDTLRGIESIRGTNSNDIYDATGFSTSSTNAGAGINAGAFNGVYFEFNEFEGGGGNDDVTGNGGTRVSYQNASGAVNVNLATGATGAAGTDTFHGGINAVRGSNFNDTLTGTDNPDNTVEIFEGMGGNDTIDGKGGFDLVSYQFHNTNGPNGVLITVGAGSTTVTGSNVPATNGVGSDTLTNIEAIRGTNNDDVYDAHNAVGFNQFEGTLGNDDITGNGSTRIAYHHAIGGVNVDLLAGTVTGPDGNDVIHGGINEVWGSQFADAIKGASANETFTGFGGNDAFVYTSANFGHDTITDFTAGAGTEDFIQFDHAIFADFNAVLAASQQVGADVVITLDAADSIRLNHVSLASLHANDFIFT